MATFSLADMSGAMSQVYRELVPQVQRKAPTLRLLAAIGRMKRNNTGDQMRWDVRFKGQASGTVNPDGGPFIQAASDQRVNASLAFGTYEAPVSVTDALRWRAEVSAGLPPDINVFAQVIDQNVAEAVETIVKSINVDIYAGAGTSNAMTGLSNIITSSGSYANINSSTYSTWVSQVDANGGSLRSLTLSMIKKNNRLIAVASPFGRPDVALCPPALMDSIESLFEAFTRVEYNLGGQMSLPAAQLEKLTMNPPVISTAGGRINADGFRVWKWENQNLWFIEDPDCTNTAQTNANNVVYLVNSYDLEFPFLPPPEPNRYGTPQEVIEAAEQQLGPIANLQLSMTPRGRTKHATEWDVMTMVGLKLKSRAAHGLIADVQ